MTGPSCPCRQDEKLHRHKRGPGSNLSVPGVVADVLRESGQAMPPAVRSPFEAAFKYDFSRVRVHTGPLAHASAEAIDSLAYTVGSHLVFARQQFQPGSSVGRRLLAHELAHVVQNGDRGSQSVTGGSLEVVPSADPSERQADMVADRLAARVEVPAIEKARAPNTSAAIRVHRKCGTREIGHAPEDCRLEKVEPLGRRFFFNVNCDTFKPGQEAELRKFSADPAAIPPAATIEVTGIASSDGPPSLNDALACRRAQVTADILRTRHASQVKVVRATGGIGIRGDDNNRAVAVRVVVPGILPPPSRRTTRDIFVVAKSYIAVIGARIGFLPLRCALFDALLPPGAATSPVRLAALAVATDLMFSEDPRTDARDKGYRLFTGLNFTVTCEDGKLTGVTVGHMITDVGNEGPITPPPLIVSALLVFPKGPTTLGFRWFAMGRPALAVEPSFQAVCPRLSRFIWHRVVGEIDCSSGGPAARVGVTGSHFPSHRIFVNNTLAAPTVPQGTFSRLWISDPSDSSRVE